MELFDQVCADVVRRVRTGEDPAAVFLDHLATLEHAAELVERSIRRTPGGAEAPFSYYESVARNVDQVLLRLGAR